MAFGIRDGILRQRGQLLGVVSQDEPSPTQQAGHGFRARADEKDPELRAFRRGEAAAERHRCQRSLLAPGR